MSYLPTLVNALTFYRAGTTITVDALRTELVEAGQIPPTALGPTFNEAVVKGYLEWTRDTRPTTWRPGKGRLVRVYRITRRARQEARAGVA